MQKKRDRRICILKKFKSEYLETENLDLHHSGSQAQTWFIDLKKITFINFFSHLGGGRVCKLIDKVFCHIYSSGFFPNTFHSQMKIFKR